jgi:serine/threonine protein kinase
MALPPGTVFHAEYAEVLEPLMSKLPTQSERNIDVSDDATLEPGFLTSNSCSSNESVSASAAGRKNWLDRLPWSHISVLSVILITGLTIDLLIKNSFDLQLNQNSVLAHFIRSNAATLFVGFGFAFYGCLVNRKLSLRIRDQRQLGPYTLHELIGSGGMGDVYLAEHQLLKRKCAIKLIKRDKASDRRMLARFEREVKATALLTHWNTVQVYDYGRTTNGTFYYAMEYLQGLNLRQLVEQFGPQPAGRVVYILRQICGALHEAHCCGLVHRDVKPSNIFLAERGHVYDVAKLLDFGLVRPARLGNDLICCAGEGLQGSPRFMCPEQARGQKPDCRGDLYSLAVVGFYLLTGRVPFEDDNPAMLVVAHATVEAPHIHKLGFDVPLDLASVISKCLKKHAADRFQTPRELEEALNMCECSNDWTWRSAEAWWQHNSTQHNPTQPAIETSLQPQQTQETLPVSNHVSSEPDKTIIAEDHVVFAGIF